MATVTITLSQNNWTSDYSKLYIDTTTQTCYTDSELQNEVNSINIPERELYRFTGYWSTSGTQDLRYIDDTGKINTSLRELTSNKTIYAQGEQTAYKITLTLNSGTGIDRYYVNLNGTAFYYDYFCNQQITKFPIPTRDTYGFLYYAGQGATSESQAYIDSYGNFTQRAYDKGAANYTLYAHWGAIKTITLINTSWVGGLDKFYQHPTNGTTYSDTELKQPIDSLLMPQRACYYPSGYWSTASTQVAKYVDSDGNFTQAFYALSPGNRKFYIQGSIVSYAYTLEKRGGSEGTDVIYRNSQYPSERFTYPFYNDSYSEIGIDSIDIPIRENYEFNGYYSQSSAGSQYIDKNGKILSSLIALTPIIRPIYAQWTLLGYRLHLNIGKGISAIYYKVNGASDWSSTVTSLVVDVNNNSQWYAYAVPLEGYVTETSESSPAHGTITNRTTSFSPIGVLADTTRFGTVVDYFDLGNDNLIPESSSNGDNKHHVCAVNTNTLGTQSGWYTNSASQYSGAWRNPTVIYRVVNDCTLNTYLGKAYAAENSSTTGYMITSVRVETSMNEFPKVIVTAVANEGADAINNFPVNVQIKARARAQNLLNAVYTTGSLLNLNLEYSCEPVVLAENMMPCASDVVKGEININSRIATYLSSDVISASNDFNSLGKQELYNGVGYKNYTFNLRKGIS